MRWLLLPGGIVGVCLFFFAAELGAADIEGTNSAAVQPQITSTNAAPMAKINAWLTFGLDRIPLLEHKIFGNPIWQYLASMIYIILAFYASKLLDALIQVQFRRWASRTKSKLDDLLVELIRGPVKVIAFVVLLHIGLRLFSWPEWGAHFISNGLKITVACSLTYVVLKAVELLMGVWRKRVEGTHDSVLDMQLFPIIQKALKIFVVVVAILVTSQNLGMNVTGLLASLSIGGLAIGLAAQDTLSNLFGAVAIFADKPFRVGDRVKLDAGIDGTVEAIGLRSTRVRNLDGFLITVPNRTMANANIVNVSQRPTIKTALNIGITYDTPAPRIERALQLIEEIYSGHPLTHDLQIGFDKFEASSINISVVHWCKPTTAKDYQVAIQSMNLALKERFDKEKINFAFPSQTVYLKQDSNWRLADVQLEAPARASDPAKQSI